MVYLIYQYYLHPCQWLQKSDQYQPMAVIGGQNRNSSKYHIRLWIYSGLNAKYGNRMY